MMFWGFQWEFITRPWFQDVPKVPVGKEGIRLPPPQKRFQGGGGERGEWMNGKWKWMNIRLLLKLKISFFFCFWTRIVQFVLANLNPKHFEHEIPASQFVNSSKKTQIHHLRREIHRQKEYISTNSTSFFPKIKTKTRQQNSSFLRQIWIICS